MADQLVRVIAKTPADFQKFREAYLRAFPAHAKKAAFVRVHNLEQVYGLRLPTIWVESSIDTKNNEIANYILVRHGESALRKLPA